MMAAGTWYEILQVPPDASQDQIREAYRTLAWQAEREEARRQLNDAYSILSNPERRAAYDQELAARMAETAPSAAPLGQPTAPSTTDAQFPQGPWTLRLWGRLHQALWTIATIRYRSLIPLNWLIGVSLVMGSVALSSYLIDALLYPEPVPAKLQLIVGGQTLPPYVTVSGTANYVEGYTGTKDGGVTENYYALHAGQSVLFFRGGGAWKDGPFTGRLVEFPSGLRDYVARDAKSPHWAGHNVLTTHYLDLDYQPTPPGKYVAGLLAVAGALLLLITARVRRYTVFVPGDWAVESVVPGDPGWPLPVEATGKFYPDGGSRRGRFVVRIPASVTVRPGSGGEVVVTTWIQKPPVVQLRPWFGIVTEMDVIHQITIPRGSQVNTGSDYTGGITRPAVRVRTGGQTVCLRFTSVADARRVADLIGA